MAKKKPTPVHPYGELAAQYRDARNGVTVCRREQAKAELELSRLQRAGADDVAVDAARERVTKAHGDVRWCQAVSIAAAEAFKGCRLDEVPNQRPVINVAALLEAADVSAPEVQG